VRNYWFFKRVAFWFVVSICYRVGIRSFGGSDMTGWECRFVGKIGGESVECLDVLRSHWDQLSFGFYRLFL